MARTRSTTGIIHPSDQWSLLYTNALRSAYDGAMARHVSFLIALLLLASAAAGQMSPEEAQRRLAERKAQRDKGESATTAPATLPAENPADAGPPQPKVYFVIDGSGTMIQCFEFVRLEVQRAVRDLPPRQPFNIIHDNPKTVRFRPALVDSSNANKAAAMQWLAGRKLVGGQGQIGEAVVSACKEKPDILWLISDGDLGGADEARHAAIEKQIIDAATLHKVKIYTLSVLPRKEDAAAIQRMKRIAESTGGQCVGRPPGENLNEGLPKNSGVSAFPGAPKVAPGASELQLPQ